jgi:hypothetical protein
MSNFLIFYYIFMRTSSSLTGTGTKDKSEEPKDNII